MRWVACLAFLVACTPAPRDATYAENAAAKDWCEERETVFVQVRPIAGALNVTCSFPAVELLLDETAEQEEVEPAQKEPIRTKNGGGTPAEAPPEYPIEE